MREQVQKGPPTDTTCLVLIRNRLYFLVTPFIFARVSKCLLAMPGVVFTTQSGILWHYCKSNYRRRYIQNNVKPATSYVGRKVSVQNVIGFYRALFSSVRARSSWARPVQSTERPRNYTSDLTTCTRNSRPIGRKVKVRMLRTCRSTVVLARRTVDYAATM